LEEPLAGQAPPQPTNHVVAAILSMAQLAEEQAAGLQVAQPETAQRVD
jgi:hypothetical protein